MKFPSRFTISVLLSASELKRLIVKDYWRITKTGFLYSETELKDKYKIDLQSLNQIIKKNSNCVINYGNCIYCDIDILGETISSRHNFILDQELNETACVTCGNLVWMKTKACLEDAIIINGLMNDRIFKARGNLAEDIYRIYLET